MSNKLTRIITALILLPFVITGIMYLNDCGFYIVMTLISLAGTWEYLKLLKADGEITSIPLLMGGAVLIPTAFYFGGDKGALFAVYIAVITVFMLKLFSKAPLKDTYKDTGIPLAALLYYPFFISFFIPLREIDFHWIFYLCIIIWSSDTLAYFVGVMFGKTRMYEVISPKKSMEGLAGGVIGGLAGGLVYAHFFMNISLFYVIISALLLTALGVVGDLAESMFKRKSCIKDSGNIIPGHGGMLDRTDSIAFAAPALYFFILLTAV